jgi:hypothetical protein
LPRIGVWLKRCRTATLGTRARSCAAAAHELAVGLQAATMMAGI